MTKKELIKRLKEISLENNGDVEHNHAVADELLIEFINDKDIEKAYNAIEKWYA